MNVLIFFLVLSNYLTEDLEPGWKILGRKQDTADFEWKTWTPILVDWLQYTMFYLFSSQILKMDVLIKK